VVNVAFVGGRFVARLASFIAIDLGDHSLYPAAFDVDVLGGDFSVERVGSTCARRLRGLGALRDADGNPVD